MPYMIAVSLEMSDEPKKNDGDGVKRYHTSLSGMPHFDKANAALD